MEHIIVQDHQLASIAYDAATETGQILFKRGGLYEYYNLPAESFEAVRNPGHFGYFSHSQPDQPSHYRAFEALYKKAGLRFLKLGNSLAEGRAETALENERRLWFLIDGRRE